MFSSAPTNHGTDAAAYLAVLSAGARQRKLHLGGHDEQRDDAGAPLLIDAHGAAVADPVWALFETVIARTRAPSATLIEWDNDVPAWPVLADEARAATRILGRAAAKTTAPKEAA